jgi:hypothetical protein
MNTIKCWVKLDESAAALAKTEREEPGGDGESRWRMK